MRTFACTACGRFTSRYCDRCPFCRQRNLVVLESHNFDALQHNRLSLQNSPGNSGPLSSLVLVCALAGGIAAFLYIWIHPSDTNTKSPAQAQLVSSAPKPASGATH